MTRKQTPQKSRKESVSDESSTKVEDDASDFKQEASSNSQQKSVAAVGHDSVGSERTDGASAARGSRDQTPKTPKQKPGHSQPPSGSAKKSKRRLAANFANAD